MNKLRIMECFGGIGACSKALERLGIDYEIADYVEIDKYAVKSFNAIHNTNFEPQDICEWNKDIEVDLIMHGSPCQDFSLAGKQAGGDKDSGTRSSLMYETIRIVEKLKPKYVIWENVKNLLSKKHRHNFDAYLETMESLGYTNYYQVLNAKDYEIPQNRERVFTISILGNENYEFPKENIQECEVINPLKDISGKSWQFEQNIYSENSILRSLKAGGGSGNIPKVIEHFEFPPKQDLKLKLKDMLEDEVDEKYYLSEKMLNCFMSDGTGKYPRREMFLQNMNRPNQDIANAIITTEGNKPTCNFVKVDETVKPSVAINFEREKEKIATTKKEIYQCECNSGWQDNKIGIKITPTIRANNNNTFCLDGNWVIRKLTPKECWRLMGFDDEDFDKASKVNSNTQLYKQAGNSICVPVLEAILKELFKNE